MILRKPFVLLILFSLGLVILGTFLMDSEPMVFPEAPSVAPATVPIPAPLPAAHL